MSDSTTQWSQWELDPSWGLRDFDDSLPSILKKLGPWWGVAFSLTIISVGAERVREALSPPPLAPGALVRGTHPKLILCGSAYLYHLAGPTRAFSPPPNLKFHFPGKQPFFFLVVSSMTIMIY